jgi:protein-S-isoprenylcysteine O-methyltransferase Ste14
VPLNLEPVVSALWISLGVFWTAGALGAKPARLHEPPVASVLHLAVLVLSFGLVFKRSFRPGPLNAFFLAPTPASQWTGLALTAAGIGIAVLARVILGRNWSGTVTVKRDHQLIRRGPYAVVRHPIYSGLALALFGTAVFHARVGSLAGFALALLNWRLKSLAEEAFMEREFGADYAEYKRRVKALIPLVW